jgi:hypothetical protein
MSDDAHDELTRQTARRLFGRPKRGEAAYAQWRAFNPELAREFSRFFVGRVYARSGASSGSMRSRFSCQGRCARRR